VRRAALAPAALALAALALTGCETTAEKSAKLERAAKAHERAAGPPTGGLAIARASHVVKVLATAVVHSREGSAAVVRLRNTSAHALRRVPIEIHVLDAHGRSIYANTVPGLGPALTAVALLPAHGDVSWVDDQIQAAGVPASVHAVVGEAASVSSAVPQLAISGARSTEAGSEPAAEGSVVNHSAVAQRELVVYAVASKGHAAVAAGRAVLQQVPARATVSFQLFFIGDPRGARVQFSAPATTLG
jgi:hypothetical protein